MRVLETNCSSREENSNAGSSFRGHEFSKFLQWILPVVSL